MKKLLTISILAATMASTAAFAGPMSGPDGDNAGKTLFVQSQQANPAAAQFLMIAQKLSDSTTRDNKAQKIAIDLDNDGHFSKGTLVLAHSIAQNDHDALVVAAMSSAREVNQLLGWNEIKVVAGSGSTLLTVYTIDGVQDSNKVHAYAVSTMGNRVTVKEVQAQKDVVAELTEGKIKAKLSLLQ